MAESTTPTTPTTTSSPAPSKQYIRSSSDDNALEPDALRGSEKIIADLKIQDDEADRRKAIENK